MKFLGWTKYENDLLEMVTFIDEEAFQKLEGKTKKFKYNIYSKSLYDLDGNFILKGNLYSINQPPFYAEIS